MESPISEASDRTVSSIETSLGYPKELMKPDSALDRKGKKCSQVESLSTVYIYCMLL